MAEMWEISRFDPGYPASLLDLDALRGDSSPERLYGRGDEELMRGLEPGLAVTIVGARRSSGYGRAVAAELAGSLAAAGLVVVSGMAYGIDSAALGGALDAGGATIAVLAGGADRAYPPSARALYRRIVATGAVISESPPGYRPCKSDFPRRNRIMAALAKMSVMVEAREPSGTRHTIDKANALGREAGAVPGPVGSALSAGPHNLIRAGGCLVRDAQDVLDLVLGVGAASAKRIGAALDQEGEAALGAIPKGGATPAQIAAAACLAPARAAVALAGLELLGYARIDAGRYQRTGLTPP